MLYGSEKDAMAPSTTDDIPSSSVSYTKLPAEIWLQICGLVVIQNPNSITVCTKPRKEWHPAHMPERTRLALASTCRWMYELATPIYYSKNEFSISYNRNFPSTYLQRFFACIGSRNVNLVTSLVLECTVSMRRVIPLRQISAMTAIRHIDVRCQKYRGHKEDVLAPSRRVCIPRGLQSANYAVVSSYGDFIESLSDLSNESGENVKRFTWTYRHGLPTLPLWDERGWVLDWHSWMSFEDLDEEIDGSDPGFVMKVLFSWGLVKASIGTGRMRIHVERHHGREIGSS